MCDFPDIEREASKSGATVLFCSEVPFKGSTSRIALVTDCFISQFKSANKFEKQSFWCDLTSFEEDSKYFSLEFVDNTFIFPRKNNIYRIIVELIQRILTQQEAESLGFEKCHFSPTPRGAFARFLLLNMKKENRISQKVKESVAEYILTQTKEITIQNESNIENYLDVFLNSIKPLDYIESIKLPSFRKFDLLHTIAQYLRKTNKICHFEINKPFSKKHFHDLCASIENASTTKFSKLSGITFVDADFSDEEIASVKTALVGGRLLSLNFINCIRQSQTSMDYMLNTILAPQITDRLRILTLDNHRGFNNENITKLIHNCGEIRYLSLQNCDLEISNVLNILSSKSSNFVNNAISNVNNNYINNDFNLNNNENSFFGVSKIDSINLSGNICSVESEIENAVINLPQGFRRLDVNNIKWSDECLTNFLTGVVKKKDWSNNLTLSLSYINCSRSEWLNVRSFFEDNHEKPPIEQLSWNGNPVSSNFVVFLKKLKNLRRLFLNNCEKINRFSTHLTEFILKSTQIEEIHIEKAENWTNSKSFFEKIKKSSSLKFLNVRFSSIGSSGLIGLQNLVRNCETLSEIAFDGSRCDTIEDILNFIAATKSLSAYRPVYVELPAIDLCRLKARPNEVEQVKLRLSECARKSNDAWLAPLEYFTFQRNDKFPRYFSSEQTITNIAANEGSYTTSNDKAKNVMESDSNDYMQKNKNSRERKRHFIGKVKKSDNTQRNTYLSSSDEEDDYMENKNKNKRKTRSSGNKRTKMSQSDSDDDDNYYNRGKNSKSFKNKQHQNNRNRYHSEDSSEDNENGYYRRPKLIKAKNYESDSDSYDENQNYSRKKSRSGNKMNHNQNKKMMDRYRSNDSSSYQGESESDSTEDWHEKPYTHKSYEYNENYHKNDKNRPKGKLKKKLSMYDVDDDDINNVKYQKTAQNKKKANLVNRKSSKRNEYDDESDDQDEIKYYGNKNKQRYKNINSSDDDSSGYERKLPNVRRNKYDDENSSDSGDFSNRGMKKGPKKYRK